MKDYLFAVWHGAPAGVLVCSMIVWWPVPDGVLFIVGAVIGANIAGMLYYAVRGDRN